MAYVGMGSFDCVAASLRGAATSLRMTPGWGIEGERYAIKNPIARATGCERDQVKETWSGYFFSLRRMVPAKPIRPVPSMVSVPGSGTTTLVSPLEISV